MQDGSAGPSRGLVGVRTKLKLLSGDGMFSRNFARIAKGDRRPKQRRAASLWGNSPRLLGCVLVAPTEGKVELVWACCKFTKGVDMQGPAPGNLFYG